MELDDLRQRWQEPTAPEPTGFNSNVLAQLLARRPTGIVDVLRRNTKKEAVQTVVAVVLAVALILRLNYSTSGKLVASVLLGAMLGQLYYYYYKLKMLHQLNEALTQNLRASLHQQLASLRALVHRYRLASLVALPVGLVMGELLVIDKLANTHPLSHSLLAMGILLLVGGVLYWPAAWFVNWYVQRLYGQHLDRLESILRELNT